MGGGGGGVNPATVGDVLLISGDAEKIGSGGSETYTLLKSIRLGRNGAYRVKFDFKAPYNGSRIWGKIYKNGNPIGTEQTITSDTYVTFSEDFEGIVTGDLVQLYCKQEVTGGGLYTRNFRIYVDKLASDSVILD